jgi:hemerythrin
MKYESWVWTDKLITGVESVDSQHQMLFTIINNLISSCNEEPVAHDHVENAINELVKYVAYHFADEEQVMRNHHFAGLARHQEQHYEFEAEILGFGLRFKRGEDVSDGLLKYVQNWLVNHILVIDIEAMKHCSN